MNIHLIDEYVYSVLLDHGWTAKRNFPLADSWIEKIKQNGIPCPQYARETLRSFGGIKIQEFSPKSAQYLLEKCNSNTSHLEKRYRRPLERFHNLEKKQPIDTYNGATLTFDAWLAFSDLEIVIDLKTAEQTAGEKLFPIGTVEPDGITCAAESKNIYTLFNDSLFLSGDCIENYLNTLFLHRQKPINRCLPYSK